MKTDVEDRIWRALSESIRREILDQLAEGPKTTGELVAHFDHLCRTAVMKHLEVLVRADLVLPVKRGRTRWNCLHSVPLVDVCERWLSQHTRRRAKSLASLKEIVEQPLEEPRARRGPSRGT